MYLLMGYHSYGEDPFIRGFAIFELVVQVLSILGNTLVLVAVVKVKIGLAGYRRFLVSLLANDLFLSIAHVLITTYLEYHKTDPDAKPTDKPSFGCVGTVLDSIQLFAVFAALFNLCAMSADHFIGIVLPLKYDYLVNTRLARASPYILWIAAFTFGFADLPIAGVVYYKYIDQPVNVSQPSYLALFETMLNSTSPYDESYQETTIFAKMMETTTAPITTISLRASKMLARTRGKTRRDSPKIIPTKSHLNFTAIFGDELDPIVPTSATYNNSIYLSDLRKVEVVVLSRLKEQSDWCIISYSFKLHLIQWFRLICTVAAFTFLLMCYGWIFTKLRKNEQTTPKSGFALIGHRGRESLTGINLRASTTSTSTTQIKRRSSKKFIAMTLLLLGAFAICWLPFIVFEISANSHLIMMAAPELTQSWLHLLQHVFNTLFRTYPLLDTIICVWRICAVRKYICQLFLSHGCQRNLNLSNATSGGSLRNTLSTRLP